MKLLMISGDRSILQGKKGAFWYTLEEFRKHWERIDIVTPRMTEKSEKRKEKSDPFEHVFFHPSPTSLWGQPHWIQQKGKELIAAHHHDVMTVHDYPPFYNGIGARQLSRATGVPYVLEVHHIVGHPVAASLTEWLGGAASCWQLPKNAFGAAAVRTVNGGVKKVLTRWGIPAEKIHVVPSFYLDADALKPDPSVSKQYDIVFCARLVANKGLAELLHAVRSLRGITLLVIGDGPERARSEALARKLGITDRVTFAGWLPDQPAVINTMQSGKVFVMNSKSEGGPRVALEAMACGMPVISTRVGVMPDVIQNEVNGVFTDGDPEHLALTIMSLLGNDAKREVMGKEATKITERFERRKLIGEYAEFLQKQAKNRQ